VTKQEVVDAVYQQTGRSLADEDLAVPEIKTLGTFECSVKLVRCLQLSVRVS
jgi:large subunit ribosomal protein L9